MPDWLITFGSVAIMILGFGFVIVIHELGHFLAAKWAGVRVLAFAVGWGSAAVSWRKGLGFRRGSSEREYFRRLTEEAEARAAGLPPPPGPAISPTEYRLSWFPVGGYVKMLGQEDGAPGATSSDPDSYSMKPVWKRMVIISAGVVFNVILAAILFVIVFTVGMRDIAPIVGYVLPGSPAARAGLLPGDVITRIDADPMPAFSDVGIAAAMARRSHPITLDVTRGTAESAQELTLAVTPTTDERTGFLQMGIGPGSGVTMPTIGPRPRDRAEWDDAMARLGLTGLQPGSTLTAVNQREIPFTPIPRLPRAAAGQQVQLAQPLDDAGASSRGAPVAATFRAPDGVETTLSLTPRPVFEESAARFGNRQTVILHLLGFTPAMTVDEVQPEGERKGLSAGDIFARMGDIEWPDSAAGIATIREHAGQTLAITVLRGGAMVDLKVPVSREGLVGFARGTTAADSALLTRFPIEAWRAARAESTPASSGDAPPPPAARLDPPIAGPMRLLSVAGTPVANLTEAREALRAATREASQSGAPSPTTVEIELALLAGPALEPRATERLSLSLTPDDLRALHQTANDWTLAHITGLFLPAQIMLRADSPWHALTMGISRTHGVIMKTYLTFARLFEGTVKVEHLKGPVGITHVGSRFAQQGFIYLLFFLALISANLAVINFLPLPIVDGGLMVFLIIEGITRRPVSMMVQNVTAIAGMLLIATMFIVVTFNDIMNLIG